MEPNNTYFADKAYTEPNDISVVENIPAKNQSGLNNRSLSKSNWVLPDNHDVFYANQSFTSENSNADVVVAEVVGQGSSKIFCKREIWIIH